MKTKVKTKSKYLSLKFKIVASALLVLFTSLLAFCLIMISIVTKEMEHQMKADGDIIVKQIQGRLASNQNITKELNNLLSEKVITSAYLIGATPNLKNEYLVDISKRLNIDEINVADANGVIIFSNMAGNLKYKYPEDHSVQKILKDKTTEVVESIRPSGNSKDTFYKYGAVGLANGGFVQIGIVANKVNTILNSVSPQALITELGKDKNIAYGLTIGKDLKVITHTEKDRIGKVLDDEGSIAAAKDGKNFNSTFMYKDVTKVYDVLVPLYENEKHIGAVDIGLSMETLELLLVLY